MTTTSRPTIAIDIDGVLYDIIGHIVDRYFHNILPSNYRPKTWECWNEFGITKKVFFDYYSECWEEAAKFTDTACKFTDSNAKYLFDTLRKLGYRINVITKRPSHSIYDTIEYLRCVGLDFDQFVVITDSHDKSKENYDIIIDDYIYNMPPIDSGKLGLLMSQKWNLCYEINSNVRRINNLKMAIPLIQNLLPLPHQQQTL